MPTEYQESTTRTRTVSMVASPFVTVADVLRFADDLRARMMPPRERVVCEHAHDTQHPFGMRVHCIEELPQVGPGPADPGPIGLGKLP